MKAQLVIIKSVLYSTLVNVIVLALYVFLYQAPINGLAIRTYATLSGFLSGF